MQAEIGGMGVGTFSWQEDATSYRLVWNAGGNWLFGCQDAAGEWLYRTTTALPVCRSGQMAYHAAKAWLEKAAAS